MITVNDLMTVNPTTVRVTDSLVTVMGRMKRAGCRQLPVVDDRRRLVGIITDRDLRLTVKLPTVADISSDQIEPLKQVSAESIMTTSPVTVEPDMPAREAARVLATYKFGALPVAENGVLVGIISVTDFMNWFADHADDA